MEKKGWKITAIICIVITVLIIVSNVTNYFYYAKEEKKINECYYNICDIYPDADYLNDVCYCYDYDVLGELVLVETKYMK